MHFCFNINQKSLGNLPIEKFFQALQSEGLNEIDRPGSTYPLNLLPLFQNPGELFPIYKKYYFSYKHTDFPKAERFYQNTIKLSVWVFKKDVKLVNLYIRGIKKVIKNYHILIYEAKSIIQKVVLAAVIIKENKVLILQRSKNEDLFPNI